MKTLAAQDRKLHPADKMAKESLEGKRSVQASRISRLC